MEEYENILKDCSDKELHLNELDYQDIVDKYGIKIHYDSLRKSQQTPFGAVVVSQYINAKKNDTSISKARDIVGEQLVLKKQIQNEKNVVRKFKNELISSISVAEDVINAFRKDGMSIDIPEQCHYPIDVGSDNSNILISLIGDWHIGYEIFDCKGNSYNWDIANERVNKLIKEIRKYVELYNINKIYVYNLGDLLEHDSMRKTQNQSCEFLLGEQIEKATKLLYRYITALSEFCNVVYDGIAGNHDRYNGDKKASYEGDNANSTITPLLAEMIDIADNKRIHVVERNYADREIINTINGVKIKFVHGNQHCKDDKSKIKNEISMDNEFYDIYCEGHFHNFRCISENRGRYLITNGCLSGFNNYSVSFGCATNASQTLIVIGENEIETVKCIDLQ